MVKRVFWVLGGLICLLVAGALLVTGVSLAFALGSSGEVSADFTSLSGPGSALVSDGLTVSPTSSFQTSFGTVTLGVHSSDGRRLFLGVAREKPLFEYLDGVPYDVVSQVTSTFATIRSVPGGETPKPPASQTFWLVQSAGESPQIDWPADAASRGYRFVVMNEDGSPAVNATLVLGFRSTRAQPASIVTSVLGTLLLIPAVWMLWRGFRRTRHVEVLPVAESAPVVAEPAALTGAAVVPALTSPAVPPAITPPVPPVAAIAAPVAAAAVGAPAGDAVVPAEAAPDSAVSTEPVGEGSPGAASAVAVAQGTAASVDSGAVDSEAAASEAQATEATSPEPAATEAVTPEPAAPNVETPEPAATEAVTPEPATPEAVTSEPATADAVTSEPAATEAVTPAEQSTSAPTETTTESPAAPPTTAPLPAPPPITPPDPPSPNP